MKIKNKYNHVFKRAKLVISEGPVLTDDRKYEEESYIKQLSNNIITYSEEHFRDSNCYGVMTLEQYLYGIRYNMNKILVRINRLRKGT